MKRPMTGDDILHIIILVMLVILGGIVGINTMNLLSHKAETTKPSSSSELVVNDVQSKQKLPVTQHSYENTIHVIEGPEMYDISSEEELDTVPDEIEQVVDDMALTEYEALQEDYVPPEEAYEVVETEEPDIHEEYHAAPIESLGTAWDPENFKYAGVMEHDGTTYTWYSQRILPGAGLTELNNNGRSVSAEGYVVDGDGFIAVASSDYPIGTELWTPFGMVKVYDSGCASGVIDIYTNW